MGSTGISHWMGIAEQAVKKDYYSRQVMRKVGAFFANPKLKFTSVLLRASTTS
jgi:hypothetical protein